jgi:outer membrane protein
MRHTRLITCNHLLWGLAGAAALASGPVSSAEWLLRVGAHSVDPKSDNHPVVSVDSGTSLTFDLTYMYTERFGVEVLAALPFEHDITLNADGSKVGETKHLPPTVSAQYHFSPGGSIHPYIGVGVNLTRFSSESTTGALSGVDLKLKTSSGISTSATTGS